MNKSLIALALAAACSSSSPVTPLDGGIPDGARGAIDSAVPEDSGVDAPLHECTLGPRDKDYTCQSLAVPEEDTRTADIIPLASLTCYEAHVTSNVIESMAVSPSHIVWSEITLENETEKHHTIRARDASCPVQDIETIVATEDNPVGNIDFFVKDALLVVSPTTDNPLAFLYNLETGEQTDLPFAPVVAFDGQRVIALVSYGPLEEAQERFVVYDVAAGTTTQQCIVPRFDDGFYFSSIFNWETDFALEGDGLYYRLLSSQEPYDRSRIEKCNVITGERTPIVDDERIVQHIVTDGVLAYLKRVGDHGWNGHLHLWDLQAGDYREVDPVAPYIFHRSLHGSGDKLYFRTCEELVKTDGECTMISAYNSRDAIYMLALSTGEITRLSPFTQSCVGKEDPVNLRHTRSFSSPQGDGNTRVGLLETYVRSQPDELVEFTLHLCEQ